MAKPLCAHSLVGETGSASGAPGNVAKPLLHFFQKEVKKATLHDYVQTLKYAALGQWLTLCMRHGEDWLPSHMPNSAAVILNTVCFFIQISTFAKVVSLVWRPKMRISSGQTNSGQKWMR